MSQLSSAPSLSDALLQFAELLAKKMTDTGLETDYGSDTQKHNQQSFVDGVYGTGDNLGSVAEESEESEPDESKQEPEPDESKQEPESDESKPSTIRSAPR